jgi:hypothetical protein
MGAASMRTKWYDDGTDVHDVWYCESEGDTITLCACGDDAECSDTGSTILCES